MCGITGIVALNQNGKGFLDKINYSVSSLYHRGPDSNGTYFYDNVALGHTRLSIIDVTDAASQPFHDTTGRYTIIFNGEIYNFKQLKLQLADKGIKFQSESDTEVLLYLYINNLNSQFSFLNSLNGFFAFAIYDNVEESLFIARDRMGIKPLLYYIDDDKFIFASEMKALLAYKIPKEIDFTSLNNYLQFNYIPAPNSIFRNVYKLRAGSFLEIKNHQIKQTDYYKIPYTTPNSQLPTLNYDEARNKIIKLMDSSVSKRLIADVPLGAFLSGGIDSSVIVALASKHTDNLNTFSIGFKDEPLFDETKYARLVAKKYHTNHTEFSLSTDDIFSILNNVLEYTDEPYADSSALAVYILSMHTRKHVTVALSGDGADELFGGYNKYYAEYNTRNRPFFNSLIKSCNLSEFVKFVPNSRNTFIGNKVRQFNRYAKGLNLNAKDRYWRWCSFIDEQSAEDLIKSPLNKEEYYKRKELITQYIDSEIVNRKSKIVNLNDVLYSDMHLVLQNDMLTKVDLMSMANSLEVRVPFLDHELVNYVFSLPSNYKIDGNSRKKILKDAFRTELPEEIFNRGKHGFEVPLLKWFRTELKSMILDDLLKDEFIIQQNIFNLSEIQKLKKRLFSNNPGDIHAQVWGLIVFQHWYKKYMSI